MSFRSDTLVHWTGHGICTDSQSLTHKDRVRYVDRLVSILSEGFYMTTISEVIFGNGATATEKSQIFYNCPTTCFTEIRLSQAERHSQKYGLLGVGVNRKFVLDRLGGPVHYVRNHKPEQIIGNASEILKYLGTPVVGESEVDKKMREEVINYYAMTLSFMKPMSGIKDDYAYLEENEWRVVSFHKLVDMGHVVDDTKNNAKRLLITDPDEVAVVILPDDITRSMAMENEKIKEWISKRKTTAVFLTVHQCTQF